MRSVACDLGAFNRIHLRYFLKRLIFKSCVFRLTVAFQKTNLFCLKRTPTTVIHMFNPKRDN